jgi:hypothetical protein
MRAMDTGSIATQLLDGERIAWAGGPGMGIRLQAADTFLIPFSLLWCGFAFFWEYSVVSIGHAPMFMRLWGIPFILVGLYFVVGRFILDAWLRGRTYYAITNQRVLIYRPAPFGRFTALSLKQLPEMNLIESANGSGTIRFGPQTPMFGRGASFSIWTPSLDPTPQFVAVASASALFRQLQQAQRNA